MSIRMANTPEEEEFDWEPQPEAALLIGQLLDAFCEQCPAARQLGKDLLHRTGTRLIDWIDHFAISADQSFGPRLSAAGFVPEAESGFVIWRHDGGLFPEVEINDRSPWRAAIKVESVSDFLSAHGVSDRSLIEGSPLGQLRKARIARENDAELWVVERHGCRGWDVPETALDQVQAVRSHHESFRQRKRDFVDTQAGFDHAITLIRAAIAELGVAWACDLFFAAERDYWTSRNRAARVQKARQDALGLGWANHDHHTYRSSRKYFATLVSVLEELGFECRERFYAGKEAGWGAQILEQPEAAVVVFADVDLAAHEVSGDFAHNPLPPSDHLGTVGLWSRLHGEAFLQAGMHHLECQFDFSAARDQLQTQEIRTMPPFTDLPYLKQAFTEGEIWPVDPGRLEAALADGAITEEQAERFRTSGAIGSHLEILQRDEGYKGFNKAGINEIIRDTDPRRRTDHPVSM